MAKTKDQKQQLVQTYTEKLGRSKSVVFSDYKGLTMAQLSDLRNKLREIDAQFIVTKNTLLELALKQAGLPETDVIKASPTATLFSYQDEILPVKLLAKALKDAQKGQIKGGIVDGELFDSFAVIALSSLPSKLELQAKVVGLLNSPLQGMVSVLQGNLRNLVYALDQIRISQGVKN